MRCDKKSTEARSDAMEQAATAVAVPVADDRGTKRGFSPAGLDADSKRPAVVHDAYKETAVPCAVSPQS